MQGLSLEFRETELTLFTDMSTHGWGAQLQDHSISGLWSEAQRQNHINILKMEAAFYAVKGFLSMPLKASSTDYMAVWFVGCVTTSRWCRTSSRKVGPGRSD